MNKSAVVLLGCATVMNLATVARASEPKAAVPPPTTREVVREEFHGVTIEDPYRWLEGDGDAKITPQVAEWTDRQNAHTRSVLEALPGRSDLEARLRKLMTVGSISSPTMRDQRYFYSKRVGSAAQSSVYVREGARGEPRLLLDPAAIDPTGLTTIAFTSPSRDGKYLAFGTYRAGDENTTAYVLEVSTGRWLADELTGKVGSVSWLPDSSGFVYRRLADVKNPYSGQVMFHLIGTHPRQDRILFEQYKEGPLATTWGPGGSLSEDGRWLILSYWTSTSSNDLWAVDFDRYLRTGELLRTPIAEGLSASFPGGPVVGDVMYMVTTHNAPNGRVVAVDLNRPDIANWKTIVAERPDVVVSGVSAARGILVVSGQSRAMTVLERYSPEGKALGAIDLGGPASAGVSVASDRTEAYLSLSSFERPPAIYRIDLADEKLTSAGGVFELWEKVDFPIDPTGYESKQVTYSSKDGTPVTMFLVHRKGLTLDGRNPVLLSGYGGFRIPTTPGFRATAYPFLEDGGVLALPNLRGGNEYGEKWHRDGMRDRKQNTFDDFEFAARWLIDNKYTSPDRLAIQGGSNGGLLVGAAVTQNPDLFAAAICGVPLLDMLRYHRFLMARFWVPEYGSSESSEQFGWLRAYSPYHAVKPGVRYPAMLITAGENDTRVHPLHARKFAAAMQEVAAAVPESNPVLLWVDRDSGHGGGKPIDLVLRDLVDQQMFIRWRLGMLKPAEPAK
jgi:prolyl oligopeptidase